VDARILKIQRLVPFFGTVRGGYDTAEVDRLVDRGTAGLLSSDQAVRAAVRAEFAAASPARARRGYVRAQVDGYLRSVIARLDLQR
jgi:hypothetical protein